MSNHHLRGILLIEVKNRSRKDFRALRPKLIVLLTKWGNNRSYTGETGELAQTGCSFKGPGFESEHLQGGSQTPVTPISEGQTLSADTALGTHVVHRHSCRQTLHYKNNTNKLKQTFELHRRILWEKKMEKTWESAKCWNENNDKVLKWRWYMQILTADAAGMPKCSIRIQWCTACTEVMKKKHQRKHQESEEGENAELFILSHTFLTI